MLRIVECQEKPSILFYSASPAHYSILEQWLRAHYSSTIHEQYSRIGPSGDDQPSSHEPILLGGGVIWVQNCHGRDTMCCCVHLQRNVVEFVPQGCHFCMFQALLLGPSHLEQYSRIYSRNAPTIQVLNSDFRLTIQALFMNSKPFKRLLAFVMTQRPFSKVKLPPCSSLSWW